MQTAMAGNVSSDGVGEHSHRNATTPPEGDGRFNGSIYEQKYWIQCEAAFSILTVFAVYVFLCILRYITTKKSTPSRDTSGKQGKRLYTMLAVASGFAVLRVASDHVVAFTSSTSDAFCFATIATSTVLYAFGLVSVYVFLWMRQSIFYSNPVLAKVLNKAVTIVSWSTLVVMLLSGISLTVLYNVPEVNGWDYQVTKDGCKGILLGDDEIVAAVATATTVYFQISLLGLFLYPLLSRKTQKYRSAGNQNKEKGTSVHNPSSLSNTDDNLSEGGGSTSTQARERGLNITKLRKGEPGSENETGVYVHSPSENEKFPESLSNGSVHSEKTSDDRIKPIAAESSSDGISAVIPTEKTKLKSSEQKRPSIFNAPRFFKAGSFFYRRNPKGKNDSSQSPTAKRSRDRILSSISQQTDNENSQRDRKQSVGTQKRKKQRTAKRTKQGRRMMTYLRKSFYMMMVCVVTDIACTVVQAQVNVPELVYLVVFDLNLMINVVCIVMSFREWDVILFPMCARSSARHSGGAMDRSNVSARPDPAAAKRRAEVLRSVTSDGATSPGVTSPKRGVQFAYNHLQHDKPQDTSTANEIPVRREVDLSGKT